MASAKQYMHRRDFGASIIQLKNLLQKNPDNGEARYLLGLALLEQGDVVSAQIELDKAVRLGASADELQVALARAALARGLADKLLERFGSTVLSAPKANAELRALLGTAHLERARPREAARAFEEALALDASNVSAQVGAARLAAARGTWTGRYPAWSGRSALRPPACPRSCSRRSYSRSSRNTMPPKAPTGLPSMPRRASWRRGSP